MRRIAKRMSFRAALAAFASACVISGCTGYNYGQPGISSPASAGSRPARQADSRMTTELARMRADIRQVAEAQRKLAAHLEDVNERFAAVQANLADLRQQVQRGGNADTEKLTELSRRIAQLQAALAAEQKARKAADHEIVRSVSSEVSSMIERTGGTGDATSGGSADSQARGTYTVKRGDTLSAIAKAFDVTLADLRKINNIDGDLIREGQKLLIPQK